MGNTNSFENEQLKKCDKLLNIYMDDKNINKFAEKCAKNFYKEFLKSYLNHIYIKKNKQNISDINIRIDNVFEKEKEENTRFVIYIKEDKYKFYSCSHSYYYNYIYNYHYPYNLMKTIDYKNYNNVTDNNLEYIEQKILNKHLEIVSKDFDFDIIQDKNPSYLSEKLCSNSEENPPTYEEALSTNI
jgi:hypothetical protein